MAQTPAASILGRFQKTGARSIHELLLPWGQERRRDARTEQRRRCSALMRPPAAQAPVLLVMGCRGAGRPVPIGRRSRSRSVPVGGWSRGRLVAMVAARYIFLDADLQRRGAAAVQGVGQ